MKKLLTATFFLGLFLFTASGFADNPKYMTLIHNWTNRHYFICYAEGGMEKIKLDNSYEEGINQVTKKLNELAKEGWELENMTCADNTFVYVLEFEEEE